MADSTLPGGGSVTLPADVPQETKTAVADAIAIGCILAGTRDWLKRQSRYNRLLASRLFILIPMAVLFANALHERPRIYFFLLRGHSQPLDMPLRYC